MIAKKPLVQFILTCLLMSFAATCKNPLHRMSQGSDNVSQKDQLSLKIQKNSFGEHLLVVGKIIADINKYYSLRVCKEGSQNSCRIYYLSPLHQFLSLDGIEEGDYKVYASLCDYRNPDSCADLGKIGHFIQKDFDDKQAQTLIQENFENNHKAFHLGLEMHKSIREFEAELKTCKLADDQLSRLTTTINILGASNLLQKIDTAWEWVRLLHDYDLQSFSIHQIAILSPNFQQMGLTKIPAVKPQSDAPTVMSRLLGFWETTTAIFRNKIPETDADIPVSYHRYTMPGAMGQRLANISLGHVTHGAALIGRKEDLFVQKVLNSPSNDIKDIVQEFLDKKGEAFYIGWAGRRDGSGAAQGWWADTQVVYANQEISGKVVSKISTKDFEEFRSWYTKSGYYSQKHEIEEVIYAVQAEIKKSTDPRRISDLKRRLPELIKARRILREKVGGENYVFLTHNCSTVSGLCLNKALKTNMFTQSGPIDTPLNLQFLTEFYRQVQSFQTRVMQLSEYFKSLYDNSQVFGLSLTENPSRDLPLKNYARNQYENIAALLSEETGYWEQQQTEGHEVQCVLDSFLQFEDKFQDTVSEFKFLLETRLNVRNEMMLLQVE